MNTANYFLLIMYKGGAWLETTKDIRVWFKTISKVMLIKKKKCSINGGYQYD